ncbi:MAG TPA: lysozyme [Solirubrobacteraceae bacterium]|nr:lysozyme [Solirubrobacteraceae bacterium]
MKVSPELINAVARWEGGRAKDGLFHPYRDSAGVWTIGFGHTAGVSAQSSPWTLKQAQAALSQELNDRYLPAIVKRGLPLDQKQLDALASFVYNLGVGTLDAGRSIGDALRSRDWRRAAADAMLLYDHAGAKKLPGLTRRRQWERQLFLGGTYDH